jgi:hypothetical protein
VAQSGAARVFYSPNKTALGAGGDCTSVIVRGGGKKQILRCFWSYLEPNYNVSSGFQGGVVPIYGRTLVFGGEFRADQMFGTSSSVAPTAGTDFSAYGIPILFDMVTTALSGAWDFSVNELATEGRIMSQGDSPLTILQCAAQIPAATQIAFVPRLHVLWRNVYDDFENEPYKRPPGERN